MAKFPITITDSPVKIHSLVPGGQGIATIESDSKISAIVASGKKGFFWNALPGETVTKYTIVKNKSHFIEAIAEEIEQPSSSRIAPRDDCYLATSPWQIMDYSSELVQKSLILQEIFRQADVISSFPKEQALDAMPKPQTDNRDFYYRNKMEYSLYWNIEKQKIQLAQHARGSHRKIPLTTSSIERPELFKKASEIIDELNSRGEEARKYQSLLLRCNQSGKVSGGLYENHQPHPNFKPLEDEILGQKYSYSPNGFFQINLPVYEMALEKIKKHIDTSKVLDLYAGVGTIGLSVARDKELTLVEVNADAFYELEKNVNAASKDSHHISPILSKSEDALNYITSDQTVILDPPRAGCHQKLLEKLLQALPPTIIYLSCNPATQARDLKILLSKYTIKLIQPYNFFPRTPHLENLVILQKI